MTDMEESLIVWIAQISHTIPLSQSLTQSRALLTVSLWEPSREGAADGKSEASRGWFVRFQQPYI